MTSSFRSGSCSPALALALLCGCSLDLVDPAFKAYPTSLRIDHSPAWSCDDHWIAYSRAFPSQDGPPGVYLVPRTGAAPRFLAPGNFFEPRDLRFSPDGRIIAGVQDQQIILIDVATGVVTSPFHSDHGADSPDWSPDGRRLCYARTFWVLGQAPESASIRIFDFETNRQLPIIHDGAFVSGYDTRWSPDGKWIAFRSSLVGGNSIVAAVTPDGSSLRRLAEKPLVYENQPTLVSTS